MRVGIGAAWLAPLAVAVSLQAAEPLPQPLTLQQALEIGAEHPVLQPLADAFAPVQVTPEPTTDSDCVRAQHRAVALRRDADRLELDRERWRYALRITRRFFDVLIADKIHARDNEEMAIAFVSLQNSRERSQLGQVSDLDTFQAEYEYAEALMRRNASLNRQRASRARLAEAIGRPGELSDKLVEPSLDYLDKELPDLEILLSSAEASNPRLRWLRAEWAAARASVTAAEAARTQWGRRGGAEAEQADAASRTLADVACDPIDPDVRRSQFLWKQKEVGEAEGQVRQAVLEAWQRVSEKRFEVRARQAGMQYRELYLDRSRAMYDLEIRADLGDAMIQMTAVEADLAAARFDLAMAIRRLAVLSGLAASTAFQEAQE